MAVTRLGVLGPAAAYPGFLPKTAPSVDPFICVTATFLPLGGPAAQFLRVGHVTARASVLSGPSATIEECEE